MYHRLAVIPWNCALSVDMGGSLCNGNKTQPGENTEKEEVTKADDRSAN